MRIRLLVQVVLGVVFIAALTLIVACDQESQTAQESAAISVEPLVTTAPQEIIADGLISPAQTMGLFELPDNAVTIPADQIEQARLIAEATEQAFGAKRLLSGVHIELPELDNAAWQRFDSPWGEVSYRLAIYAEGAGSLRPHFAGAPEGVELLIYGDDPEEYALAAAPSVSAVSDDFWGPTVAGSVLFVELVAEPSAVKLPVVDLLSVGLSGDQVFDKPPTRPTTCYLDPTCYSAWSPLKSGVAYITFEEPTGQYICSAGLLNDTTSSGTPWLLTANHCLSSDSVADTLEVVWNYHTSACNGTVPTFSALPRTLGSDYLVGNSASDYTLLLLDSAPPAGTTYLGWSTANLSLKQSITALHHPGGSWTRITFGSVTATSGNFWKVVYSQSSTEGGSSGCPLFNANKQVVGQLYGGTAACNKMKGYDIYGKFGISYNDGLKNYLGQ